MFQDLRYGARMLWKRPGFTVVVSLTLALGIGANTAIFGVVDRLLVRLLPVNEPARLVNLIGRDEKGGEDTSFSYPTYKDYRDQNDVFDGLLAYSETAMNLNEGGQPERIMGVLVIGDSDKSAQSLVRRRQFSVWRGRRVRNSEFLSDGEASAG